MKTKLFLLVAFITSITLCSQKAMAQSWSITGNNNTTPLSKLGTTNFIPLSLYTNNQERVRVDEIGRVGIGISSPVNILTVKSTAGTPSGAWTAGLTSPVFVGFADNASSEFVLSTASNTAVRRSVIQGRKSRGSLAAPTVVANNDYLTSFLASGFDGNTFQNPAAIDFFVDGTPSAGNVPARISFVTGSNQTNRAERLKVGSTGNFNFNDNQLTLQKSTGNVGIGTGDLNFFNSSQTIQFPAPAATNNAMINMFPSGTQNESRMVIAHSPAFQNFGLRYTDASDAFDFLSAGNPVLSVGLGTGNVGIGTNAPESKLHVLKGSAGAITGHVNASLVLENSNHNYLNILAPTANETGVLFGNPTGEASGGILYNSAVTLNGFQFRTHNNVLRMVLTEQGNLGVGTFIPGSYKAKLSHNAFGLDLENVGNGADWELVTLDNLSLYFDGLFRGSFNTTTGAYTAGSDERLKTNIKPMTTMLEKINKLKPSTYQFKSTADKQDYMGFIAQDVMKVFPSLVTHNVNKERDLDLYTMDYSGFGVIAVKGIQELQPIVEEQKKINEDQKQTILALEDRLAKLEAALLNVTAKSGSQNIPQAKGASLEQNEPNPVNQNSIIRYRLPLGSKGQIRIFDQTGNLVKTLVADQSGQSTVSAFDLTSGTYSYALFVDGRFVSTKKMVVLR